MTEGRPLPFRHWIGQAKPFLLLAPGLLGLIGLLGVWSRWADAAAHLAPVTVWIAAAAALFVFDRSLAMWVRLGLVLGVTANLALVAPDRVATARAKPGSKDLVVMSFNIWDASRDQKPAIAAIRASGADVVTLQEGLALLKTDMKGLKDLYPYRATCGQWWGCEIVILSKRPLRQVGWKGVMEGRQMHPWTVWAVTDAPDGRPVRIVSTHLAWPLPPGRRARQIEALTQTVKALGAEDTIVTGDLNGTGASWSLRGLDRALAPMTRRTRNLGTWPDRIPGLDMPIRTPVLGIDHLYASRPWRTVQVSKGRPTGSDHRSITVRLSRAGRPR